ncbi:MAG: hypothetical protein V4634_01955 [Pseudomonadota bacterium]
MKWRIIPVEGNHEYSEATKKFAHTAALEAALATQIEFIDVDQSVIALLGQKWERYFLFAYMSLKKRYGGAIDDLIMLADRMNKYASVYETALRQRPAELSPENGKQGDTPQKSVEVCGTLLLQHFSAACRKELLEGTEFERISFFPDTGDILEALSVNRIMQAAVCINDDRAKMLDLLSDAMSAKFFHTQGAMHIESFFARKNDRKVIAQKGAAVKLENDPKQKEKAHVLECWKIWQALKPKEQKIRYKSKAAFARDMLTKYENLDSAAVIERWCREWEADPVNATLLAQ